MLAGPIEVGVHFIRLKATPIGRESLCRTVCTRMVSR